MRQFLSAFSTAVTLAMLKDGWSCVMGMIDVQSPILGCKRACANEISEDSRTLKTQNSGYIAEGLKLCTAACSVSLLTALGHVCQRCYM